MKKGREGRFLFRGSTPIKIEAFACTVYSTTPPEYHGI